jgi:hypothetical protein
VFPVRYELNSYIVFRKRLVPKRLMPLAYKRMYLKFTLFLNRNILLEKEVHELKYIKPFEEMSLACEARKICVVNKKKLHGLNPLANYTDRATTACRLSDCQLLRIEGATWSA